MLTLWLTTRGPYAGHPREFLRFDIEWNVLWASRFLATGFATGFAAHAMQTLTPKPGLQPPPIPPGSPPPPTMHATDIFTLSAKLDILGYLVFLLGLAGTGIVYWRLCKHPWIAPTIGSRRSTQQTDTQEREPRLPETAHRLIRAEWRSTLTVFAATAVITLARLFLDPPGALPRTIAGVACAIIAIAAIADFVYILIRSRSLVRDAPPSPASP
jgi:hypothetical protein